MAAKSKSTSSVEREIYSNKISQESPARQRDGVSNDVALVYGIRSESESSRRDFLLLFLATL